MADPLQNAAFIQSLFAPVSASIAGPSEANLKGEQLRYQDRLRQIKREQDLEDQRALADQRTALTNLTIAGQANIADKQTDRLLKAEESKDQRVRDLATDSQLAAARLAYANARGTKKPPGDLSKEQLIEWYGNELGGQKEEAYYEDLLKASNTTLRGLGGKVTYADGASFKDKYFQTNDAIADIQGESAKSQAGALYKAREDYEAEKQRIFGITDKDAKDALAAGLSSVTDKDAREDLKNPSIAAGLKDYDSVVTFLNRFPSGSADFEGAYNRRLSSITSDREQKSRVFRSLEDRLSAAEKAAAQNGLVGYHVNQMAGIKNAGGDPYSYARAGTAAEARTNLGDTAAAAKPSAASLGLDQFTTFFKTGKLPAALTGGNLAPGYGVLAGEPEGTDLEAPPAGPAPVDLAAPFGRPRVPARAGQRIPITDQQGYVAPEVASNLFDPSIGRGRSLMTAPSAVQRIPITDPANAGRYMQDLVAPAGVPQRTPITDRFSTGAPTNVQRIPITDPRAGTMVGDPWVEPTPLQRTPITPQSILRGPSAIQRVPIQEIPTAYTRDLDAGLPVGGDIETLFTAPRPVSTEVDPRRVDAVTDSLRAAVLGMRRPLFTANDNPAILSDLYSRYNGLRDKQSPRALEILQQIESLIPAERPLGVGIPSAPRNPLSSRLSQQELIDLMMAARSSR
jgi:hypothetical protein